MHYPWWHVPFLTSPLLIAAIATVHVFVSMYAVGGGFFLAVETLYAYRTQRRDYLAYLRDHAWFFILLTVVFGAITGVGIWWTIGLASPLATEALIHIFVFGWAMEYVFFVLEIAAAFIFYYYWGRLEAKTHQTIGWIYAIAAWISLVLITGITAFMLNPGGYLQNREFWTAFLNPEFLPQTIARTGGAFLLASLYVYLHATFRVHDHDLRNLIESRSARPALLGAILVTLGGMWWYIALPESAQAALISASTLNILMLLIFGLTVVVFVMMYLGPYRNPGWLSPGFAILFFACGLAAVGTGEFIREAVRKPYIVYNVVLGNQILPEEISRMRTNGYLESGVWTRAYVSQQFPQLLTSGKIDYGKMQALAQKDQAKIGEVIFQYHCNDCHAASGYSGADQLLRGWTPQMIRAVVDAPERTQFFMPPFAGNLVEAQMLTEYLKTIAQPFPAGMNHGGGK